MADFRHVRDLIAKLKENNYNVVFMKVHLKLFEESIEKCHCLKQNGEFDCDSIDYRVLNENYCVLYGMLRGIEIYQFISSEFLDTCIDDLRSVFDF